MIRAVLDEAVPADAASILRGGDVLVDAFPDPWRSLPDRAVLESAVAAKFDWLITCDKRMPYQQNLKGYSISVLVLPTPKILELKRIRDALCTALMRPLAGRFIILDHRGHAGQGPAAHMLGSKQGQA